MMNNFLQETKERLQREEAEAIKRITSTYECVICHKSGVRFEEWQRFAWFRNNNGEIFNHMVVQDQMIVCSEECRVGYIRQGCVPAKYLMEGVGIPKRYEHANLGMLTTKKQEQYLAWLRDNHSGVGLYMCGAPGTGKTFTAAALATYYRQHEKTVRFTTGGQLANMANFCKEPAQFFKFFTLKDILIIDDLTKHNLSGTAKELLFEMFNNLYNEMRILIITSNLSFEDVAEHIDERLGSRLNEMCQFQPFTGVDKRKTNVG